MQGVDSREQGTPMKDAGQLFSGAKRLLAAVSQLPEQYLLLSLFVLAFFVKFIAVVQFTAAPNFALPFGDAEGCLRQAENILAGRGITGGGISFQSPLYPMFMAAVFFVFGKSFFILRLIQIVFGALNCVTIYLITRALTPGEKIWPFLTALAAVFYGLFTFYDMELLAISITVFFLNIALWLLLISREWRDPSRISFIAGCAGVCLGIAVLGRTNILLFVPFVLWYLGNGLRLTLKSWAFKPMALFMLGLSLVVLPLTINNYRLEKDFVLVSANAGVNFYIGNNCDSRGTFLLPAGSALSDQFQTIFKSARQEAERATGQTLKPSQVSRYWFLRGWDFIVHNPRAALRLYARKVLLLVNHGEIPNHLSMEHIRNHFVGMLRLTFLNFGLIAPVGLLGIGFYWRRRQQKKHRLLIVFVLVYACSLLPFFITARYRLPLISILIIYSVLAIKALYRLVIEKQWGRVALSAGVLVVLFFIVGYPMGCYPFYHNYSAMGDKYFLRSREIQTGASDYLGKAAVQYKQAIETDYTYAYAYFGLAHVYTTLGFYSGAIDLMKLLIAHAPSGPRDKAAGILPVLESRRRKSGDRIDAAQIPLTPFERAVQLEDEGRIMPAISAYRRVIRVNPYCLDAYKRLSDLYRRIGETAKAERTLSAGRKNNRGRWIN